MRQHNKYLEKVYEEMDVYRQHLLTGSRLSPQQEDTYEKIDIMRGWLREGFSDMDVIKLAKNDPRLKVQDRRAREILAMTYEVFAELRQLRNREGIKYMYAESLRSAAQMVMDMVKQITMRDEKTGDETKEVAALIREFRGLMKEAGTIDGAYDTSKASGQEKKKPTKIVIKRKTVIRNGNVESDNLIEEAEYDEQ